MDDPTLKVLAPDEDVKLSDGRTVTVRKMPWKKAQRMLNAVLPQFGKFLSVDFGSGKLSFDLGVLLQVLSSELADDLILAATDLTPADLEVLYPEDILDLSGTSLALNITEPLIAAGKRFAEKLRPVTGMMRPSATPTTTSSASAATPGSTSIPAPSSSST